MNTINISVVVPCYNEEEVLGETSKRLLTVLSNLEKKNIINNKSFILFVDDGSKDNTWKIIEDLSKKNKMVRGLSFSRNYGHQNALFAGLMYSKEISDCIISIDADLQQDENAILEFIEKFNEGFEIVNGVRVNRESDTFFKKTTATFFYKLMKFMGVEIIENSADYRLLSSRVVKELENFGEVNLFLRGLFPVLGFKTTTVNHEVRERFAGKSKYSIKKMLMFALEGITSFSIVPIRIITFVGILSLLFCILMMLYVFYVAVFTDNAIQGWASTVIPLYLIGSIQIISLGIIGEYIGRTYMESKKRPKYIIDKTTE